MNHRITVVGVITKDNTVLLGRKPKDVGPYPNTWIIPGGGVNFGEETAEEALMREIREEANIEIENIHPLIFIPDVEPNKYGEPTYYVHLVYTASYKSGEVKAQDDVASLAWVSTHDIPKLIIARPSVITFEKLGWLS